MKSRHRSLGLMLLLGTGALAVAASQSANAPLITGSIHNDTSLYADHYADAQVLASLKDKTLVQVFKQDRPGPWFKILANGVTGWVRVSNLSTKEGRDSTLTIQNVAASFNTDSTRQGSSTGAKGFRESDVQTAKPNNAEVGHLEHLAVSAAVAQDYARHAGLKAVTVPELQEGESGS